MSAKRTKKDVNIHAKPRIVKVIVNAGIGKNRDNKAYVEAVIEDIKKITGQQPQTRTARKAVAGFNVRQGNLVGLRVNLRGKRRDDFVQRFVHIALPRVRDFRGVQLSALDGHGNLNIGIEEQLAFPEINAEKTDIIFGLQVTFVTSAANDKEAEELFRSLGFPLVTDQENTHWLSLIFIR